MRAVRGGGGSSPRCIVYSTSTQMEGGREGRRGCD